MSRHQKRLSVPDSWPVERKTDTFTVKAGAGPHGEAGVPLVVLLRDVLGYVDDRKEARYALGQHGVLVNGEPAADEDRPIGMFDILGFPDRAEFYRVFPDEGGRLSLTPIDADAADSRLGKVAGKRQVDGGATQLTLHDGTNVTVDDATAYATTDSLVIDVDDKSVVAHFPFEEDSLVTAIQGNHAGKIGRIDAIDVTAGSGSNIVHVRTDDDGFETVEEYVVVIDEQFAESTDAQSSSDASAVEGDEVEDAGGTDEGDVDESEDVDSDESDDEPETDPTDETAGDEESTDDASEDANDADGGEDAPDGGEDA